MKTKNIIFITVLLLLMCMISCNKDHDIPIGKTFNSTESGGGNSSGGGSSAGGGSSPDMLTVSISANPSNGGTVNGGGKYQKGEICTVTASVNECFIFTNWTENDSLLTTQTSYTFTVTNNRTLIANFEQINPIGVIDALFTINSEGDQVYFSQGNLQYNAPSRSWQFAAKQYDYIGDDNNYISQNYNGCIDLFGWGTSGINHGAICYQPWSTSTNSSDYFAYGNYQYNLYDQTGKADWGYNSISYGGNVANFWRTLTQLEWSYVFNTRTTSSGILYAKAQITGTSHGTVNGVILFPDDWSTSTYAPINYNQSGASYSDNSISVSQWATLESAGAVFLPTTGYRKGTTVENVSSDGHYWSTSRSRTSNACYLYFSNTVLDPSIDIDRHYGLAVRLVCSWQ